MTDGENGGLLAVLVVVQIGFALWMLYCGCGIGTASVQKEALERGFMYHDARTGELKWKEEP